MQEDFEHLSLTSSRTTEKKARLVYCKSHVAIHPTTFNKDNLSGYLGLVEVDASDVPRVDTDSDGNVKSILKGKKELLVTWVPNELLERMDEADREGYKRVATGFSHGPPKEQEEDGTSVDCKVFQADEKVSYSFRSHRLKGKNTHSRSRSARFIAFSFTQ